jgi:hypothetical protein
MEIPYFLCFCLLVQIFSLALSFKVLDLCTFLMVRRPCLTLILNERWGWWGVLQWNKYIFIKCNLVVFIRHWPWCAFASGTTLSL